MTCRAAIAAFAASTLRICKPSVTLTGSVAASWPRSAAFAGAIAPVAVVAQPGGAVCAPVRLIGLCEPEPLASGIVLELWPPEQEAVITPVTTARTAILLIR